MFSTVVVVVFVCAVVSGQGTDDHEDTEKVNQLRHTPRMWSLVDQTDNLQDQVRVPPGQEETEDDHEDTEETEDDHEDTRETENDHEDTEETEDDHEDMDVNPLRHTPRMWSLVEQTDNLRDQDRVATGREETEDNHEDTEINHLRHTPRMWYIVDRTVNLQDQVGVPPGQEEAEDDHEDTEETEDDHEDTEETEDDHEDNRETEDDNEDTEETEDDHEYMDVNPLRHTPRMWSLMEHTDNLRDQDRVASGQEEMEDDHKDTDVNRLRHTPPMWSLVKQLDNLQVQVRELKMQNINLTNEIERRNSIDKAHSSSIHDINEELSKPRCQTGTVYFEQWPWVDINSVEVHNKTATVAFTRPFKRLPEVSAGITQLDIDHNRNARVHCWWSDLKPTSFRIECRSWGNTKLYRLRVAWIAC